MDSVLDAIQSQFVKQFATKDDMQKKALIYDAFQYENAKANKPITLNLFKLYIDDLIRNGHFNHCRKDIEFITDIHFMNTGEYKEFTVATPEGRKELKEIFCGLGYGAWFISDFYIKKDYFLPNSKLLLKKMSPFTYLHASDILICDVEKVTIKNIYSGELGLGKLQNEVFLIYTGNDQNKQAKTVVLDRFVNGKTTTEIRQKRLVDTIGSDRQYTFGTK